MFQEAYRISDGTQLVSWFIYRCCCTFSFKKCSILILNTTLF